MSAWETPSFLEIDMSAEIGGYQGEDERPDYGPAYLHTAAVRPADHARPAPHGA